MMWHMHTQSLSLYGWTDVLMRMHGIMGMHVCIYETRYMRSFTFQIHEAWAINQRRRMIRKFCICYQKRSQIYRGWRMFIPQPCLHHGRTFLWFSYDDHLSVRFCDATDYCMLTTPAAKSDAMYKQLTFVASRVFLWPYHFVATEHRFLWWRTSPFCVFVLVSALWPIISRWVVVHNIYTYIHIHRVVYRNKLQNDTPPFPTTFCAFHTLTHSFVCVFVCTFETCFGMNTHVCLTVCANVHRMNSRVDKRVVMAGV